VGAALLASTQGGVSPRPLIRLSLELPRHISLSLAAAPSAAPLALSAPQGSVDVRQDVVVLDLAYTLTAPEAVLRPTLAAGGGFCTLRVDGAANHGFLSQHGEDASGLVSASASVGIRIADGLAAVGGVTAIVLLPGQAVVAVGVPLAHLGQPAFLPSLGLAASF